VALSGVRPVRSPNGGHIMGLLFQNRFDHTLPHFTTCSRFRPFHPPIPSCYPHFSMTPRRATEPTNFRQFQIRIKTPSFHPRRCSPCLLSYSLSLSFSLCSTPPHPTSNAAPSLSCRCLEIPLLFYVGHVHRPSNARTSALSGRTFYRV